MELINSFFCSISVFFFNNIFTFLLFFIIGILLYLLIISKLSKITNIIFFTFLIEIFAGGLVIFFLRKNCLSSTLVSSYYLGFLELVTLICLVISILFNDLLVPDIGKSIPKKRTLVKNEKTPVKKIEKEERISPNKEKEETTKNLEEIMLPKELIEKMKKNMLKKETSEKKATKEKKETKENKVKKVVKKVKEKKETNKKEKVKSKK